MEQIIRQKIFTTLQNNISQIADIVAAELKGTDFPEDMQSQRDSVSGKLYEMWLCIKLLPIQCDTTSGKMSVTFKTVQKCLMDMQYSLILLISKNDPDEFQQFYASFVSIVAFFESMECSKITPYLPLSEETCKRILLNERSA